MSAKSPDVDFDVSLAPEDSWDVEVAVSYTHLTLQTSDLV